jgi:hypothetical protein
MSFTHIVSYVTGLYHTVVTAFTCSLWGAYLKWHFSIIILNWIRKTKRNKTKQNKKIWHIQFIIRHKAL